MRKGRLGSAFAKTQTILGMTFPSSNMEWAGASDLLELSLTEPNNSPFTLMSKARSKIIRNNLDLCGMAAIGDTFKFGGIPSLFKVSQSTNRQHFSLTLARASSLQAFAASGVLAEG